MPRSHLTTRFAIGAVAIMVISLVTSGAARAQTPAAPSAEPPPQLFMSDGQLKSHGIVVHVANAQILASANPELWLMKSHSRLMQKGSEGPFRAQRVADHQRWSTTVDGRREEQWGTVLIFDVNAELTMGPKAMVRVRPILTWTEEGRQRVVLGTQEVNVADTLPTVAWTLAATVAALAVVVLLGRKNPLGFLLGVDGRLSLSQTQIACWTIVVASLVFGYGLIRHDIPDIPDSLIVLMGLSLGTGGVAYLQDAKRARATGPPAQQTWKVSDLVHIFTEGFEPELSLAKAQMLLWTLLLLLLFVSKSVLDGQIWAVPWELVVLMGFSQAGYLAPKVAQAG